MARVYLAGPDVFFPNFRAIFDSRVRFCRELGLDPLVPVDDNLTTSRAIYEGNLRLLDRTDGIIANITPFRGPHCDVGTAWEIGYAISKAKPVFAYTSDARPLIERIPNVTRDGRDSEGNLAEDFGLVENLMIAECVVDRIIFDSFEKAAKASADYLSRQQARAPVSRRF